MRQDVDFTNFSAGELSPLIKARIDQAKFYNGCDTLLNMVALPQGGATRRPGTLYVFNCKMQGTASRLIPFIFSTVQAYMLEFSSGNVRIFMNDGVVLNGGGVPVDVAVPYLAADLAAIKVTQSADTLFIAHPNYPLATLSRSSHTSWTYTVVTVLDGPYLNANGTATTLTPSAVSGSITVTASSIVGINPTAGNTGTGFQATDVGRLIRIKVTAAWGWVLITAVPDTTHVTATVQAAVNNGAAGVLDGTSATASWRLGKWSKTTGYPYATTFWQQRLMLAGSNNQPNAVEGSNTGDFLNFSPTNSAGTVADTNAISFVISDDEVNAVRWLVAAGAAQSAQLGIGTDGGEDIMQAYSTSAALTPTNVQVYRETSFGSASNVPAIRIAKSVLFFDRPGRKCREWTFQWQVNGYVGPDISVLAEHITRSGVVTMAYQQSPYGVVWCVRADGTLIGLTYLREQDVVAWHRHQLGGNYYGGPPRVESVAVIPSPDATYDELWLTVLRTINGVPTRFIEVMTRYFDAMPQEAAVFLDAATTSVLAFPAATLTASASSGSGVTFTASAAVFSGASAVNSLIRYNGGLAVVRSFTDTRHVVGDWYAPASSLAPASSGAWSCTPPSTNFSGLTYLIGETVGVLGDGADFGTQTVGGAGALALPSPGATLATAGLPSTFDLITMPLEPQKAAAISSQGKVRRVDHIFLRLREALGCNFGRHIVDPDTGVIESVNEPLETRSAVNVMGQAPPLFTGILRLPLAGGYDQECQLELTGSGPFPFTVLAIGAKGDVGDMPVQAG